jgi:hypothetical protein
MSFTFMAFHHPRPEHREDLLRGMAEFSAVLGSLPGLIEAGAWEQGGDPRIVAISRWESRAAFETAWPVMAAALADTPFDVWEEREAELFLLDPVRMPEPRPRPAP